MWTRFHDMCSGGSRKEKYHYIYIESESEEQAKTIFYNRFGHNPERVTCTCCGEDYSIDSEETIEAVTAYERRCKWVGQDLDPKTGMDVKKYIKSETVLVIKKEDVKEEEKTGDVPCQGYIWID